MKSWGEIITNLNVQSNDLHINTLQFDFRYNIKVADTYKIGVRIEDTAGTGVASLIVHSKASIVVALVQGMVGGRCIQRKGVVHRQTIRSNVSVTTLKGIMRVCGDEDG